MSTITSPQPEFPESTAVCEAVACEAVQEQPVVAKPEPPRLVKHERLASLDAFRGFDMFWIVGGGAVVLALAKYTGWGWLQWLSGQLEHPLWNGFAFYDLIFPTFLFISGVTMPFSLIKRLEAGDERGELYLRVLRRVVLLVVLGIIYNGFLKFDWANTRYPSVLGRIGLAYGGAALIVMQMCAKPGRVNRVPLPVKLFLCFVALLLGYWAMLVLIPVPGVGRGAQTLTIDGWLGGYIDRHLIPGKLYRGVHDPEGLVGTIPAVATALLGVMTGFWLRWGTSHSSDVKPSGLAMFGRGLGKTLVMAAVGAGCLKLGRMWDPLFPINKNMWSSSFVLYAGGWSLIFLSIFYFVIDVLKLRRWAFFFTVIGMNPITIYLAVRFISFKYTADALFGGALKHASEASQPVLAAIAVLGVDWLFLYFLYRKKVFVRV